MATQRSLPTSQSFSPTPLLTSHPLLSSLLSHLTLPSSPSTFPPLTLLSPPNPPFSHPHTIFPELPLPLLPLPPRPLLCPSLLPPPILSPPTPSVSPQPPYPLLHSPLTHSPFHTIHSEHADRTVVYMLFEIATVWL